MYFNVYKSLKEAPKTSKTIFLETVEESFSRLGRGSWFVVINLNEGFLGDRS